MDYLSSKIEQVRARLAAEPLDDHANAEAAAVRAPVRSLAAAITGSASKPAVIAELKRSSPSAGSIAARDAVDQAVTYQRAGAAAISVLTDESDFGGSNGDLIDVKEKVSVPVLRKDFLVHPSQLVESRAIGADAVLLIASAVGAGSLSAMLEATHDMGLEALVETHDEDDLEAALSSGAPIVGVNARDLRTLEVDVASALIRLKRIPSDRLAVLESGIGSREDVKAAEEAGVSAVLIGATLMRAEDAAAKLAELMGR